MVRILQGKRHLSIQKVPGFVSLLKLGKRRAEYFELLVLYGRAKSDREAKQYFERLLAFTSLGGKQVGRSQYEFYQEWYYTAVREVLYVHPFKWDYDALAAMMVPAITPKEARKAVSLLEKLGMIVKLKARLMADKQVLSLDPVLQGLVVDDAAAVLAGTWSAGAAAGSVGPSYKHDGNANKGAATGEASVTVNEHEED